ncbi:hypothetical protein IAT38_006327 [Cryptococcus sp. DSM 104549]
MDFLLCRPSHAHAVDPLPSGYGRITNSHPHPYSVPRAVLGPTFVPLQPPPDGEMDPETFRKIKDLKQNADLALAHMKLLMDTQGKQTKGPAAAQWNTVHACIRDYFEQTFTGWLLTHREHTKALRQLSLAGLYFEHGEPVDTPLTPGTDDYKMYGSMRLSRQSGLSHLTRGPYVNEDETPAPVQNSLSIRRHAQTDAPPFDYANQLFAPQTANTYDNRHQHPADTAPTPPEKPRRVHPASLQLPLVPPSPLAQPSVGMQYSHSHPVGLALKDHHELLLLAHPRPRPATWDVYSDAPSVYAKALQGLYEKAVPEGKGEYVKALEKVRRAEGGVGGAGGRQEEGGEREVKKHAIRRIRPPSRDPPRGDPAAALARLTQGAPTTAPGNKPAVAYECHGVEGEEERKTETTSQHDDISNTHASSQDASPTSHRPAQLTHPATPSTSSHPLHPPHHTPDPLPDTYTGNTPGLTPPPKFERNAPDAPASDVTTPRDAYQTPDRSPMPAYPWGRLLLAPLLVDPDTSPYFAEQESTQGQDREGEREQAKETDAQNSAGDRGDGYESWDAARRTRFARRLSDQLDDIERMLHIMPRNSLLATLANEADHQDDGNTDGDNRAAR